MVEPTITIKNLCESVRYNSYYVDVIAQKAKAAKWLIECIEGKSASKIKNLFMEQNYDEIYKYCEEINKISFESSHSYGNFIEEFTDFCIEFRNIIIKRGLSEKEEKRKKLIEELKALDECE